MAGSRGYQSYSGRGASGGKIALAVILVLVIAAAILVIAAQRYIVYDETGTPQLTLPWQENVSTEEEGDVTEEPPEEVEIIPPEPEKPEEIRGFSIPVGVLTGEKWEAAKASASADSTIAVTLKDSNSTVYFDTAMAVSGTVKTANDTMQVLSELTGETSDYHTIARISCFHDPKAAKSDVRGMGLRNTGGYIFYDGNNSQWLDPAKPAARQYLCNLAAEAAALGFDEILLTDVSYPTEGKLHKISYGETAKNQNMQVFLEEMRAALEVYDVKLSIELPTGVITEGRDDTVGLVLSEVVSQVDRIYSVTTPDRVATLNAVIGVTDEEIQFIPEFTVEDPAFTENCLVLK